MIRFIVVMVPAVFLINGLTKHDWLEALLFARGRRGRPHAGNAADDRDRQSGQGRDRDVARKKVIVKRLNAIQNFGAMDVLCTDKTGTLTQDRIILKRHLDIRGEEFERVLQYAYLNSHFQSGLKNLLDVAVLQHVEAAQGTRASTRTSPRSTRFPSTSRAGGCRSSCRTGDDKHVLICKGAVEEIFAVCTRYEIDGTTGLLDESHFATAKEETVALNSDGFRVVAVAYKETARPQGSLLRRRRERPDAARLHRLPRPAQGERGAGDRRAGRRRA